MLITPAINSFFSHRYLIWQLTKREVIGRYKGSFLGLAWSFLNPLFTLAVYTFVFSTVFKAHWGASPNESKGEFALTMFCGLIAFNLFSETVVRSPGLILSNANYVKRVVFPLEILPLTLIGAALIHAFISIFILLVGALLILGKIHWTLLFFPLTLLPLLFFSVGLSWILSSLGVFIRDLQQLVAIMIQLFMFLTPVFYPITALPEPYRTWMEMNPLAPVLENFRRVLIWGVPPEWGWLMLQTAMTFGFAFLGYAWFSKTRKGFADVI